MSESPESNPSEAAAPTSGTAEQDHATPAETVPEAAEADLDRVERDLGGEGDASHEK